MTPPARERLPDECRAETHHVRIQYAIESSDLSSTVVREKNAYITVGFFPDGRVGEVFMRLGDVESSEAAMADVACIFMSLGLQHGVPLEAFVVKLIGTRCEFAGDGWTSNPAIPKCASLIDYLGKWLKLRFCPPEP